MKKTIGAVITLILILLFINALADVKIDKANFPDVNFRDCVKEYDNNHDGKLSDSEISAVIYMNVSNYQIENLKGIEHFKYVKMIWADSNNLTQVDVSKNSALEQLFLDNNQLTKIDVSKNKNLTRLACMYNQLTRIDVSKNTALTSLSIISNHISKVDVSKNPELEELHCGENDFTEIDLTHNPKLKYFSCYEGKLTKIDVSKNPELLNLDVSRNNISELDLSKNTKLEAIECSGNPLKELDVSKCTKIDEMVRKSKPTNDFSFEKSWHRGNCRLLVNSGVEIYHSKSVRKVSVTSIRLNKQKVTLKEGDEFQLTVKTLKPNNATNKKVVWSSSDKKVATVDKNGKVVAKKKGSCIVTCTAADGKGAKVECKIKVK